MNFEQVQGAPNPDGVATLSNSNEVGVLVFCAHWWKEIYRFKQWPAEVESGTKCCWNIVQECELCGQQRLISCG